MEIEFNNLSREPLCFYHAVKAVMEDNEKVSASAPDNVNSYDMDGTGYLGQTCIKCFPPTVYEEEEYED